MRFFFLFLILNSTCFILNSFAQSPDWLWAKSMGGTSADYGQSITVDASGNVYTTGHFMGTADFDPDTGIFNLTPTGWRDMFITKLDSSGNFVWAKRMGGAGSGNTYGQSIALDPSGNLDIYITGSFGGIVDFDPGPGVYNLTSIAGSSDIFICKLDSAGNFVWAIAMGGPGGDDGFSIAIDTGGNGDIYTTGQFQSTADFDPGAGVYNLTVSDNDDIFISKLDSSGNFIWAKRIGGIDSEFGYSITLDPAGSGDVYATGNFHGTVDFDPGNGVFNLTSVGLWDNLFISKLDGSGNFVWAKLMGGGGNGVDYSYSITIEHGGSGNVYVIGCFQGTADFDPGVGIFNLSSNGSTDIFINKLDNSGNFVWAKSMGGSGYDEGISITINPTGNEVYTTGYFSDSADFDPGAGVFNLTGGGAFITKLDSNGNFVWGKTAGGNDIGNSIFLDVSGNLYVTGYFGPSSVFGSTILTSAGDADIFIARLDSALVTAINEKDNFGNKVSLFPNPISGSTVIFISLLQSQKVTLKIFDVNGRLVSILADEFFDAGENNLVWNTEEVDAGIYFLQFQSSENLLTKKLIVTK